jgi:hypothetical protein
VDRSTILAPEGEVARPLVIGAPTGLLAYYPMDGDASEANSASLNGIAVGGVASVTDRFGLGGMATSFNGIDSWLVLPGATTDAREAGTINVWVKRENIRDAARCGRDDLAYLQEFSCQHNIFAKASAPNAVTFRAQFLGMPVDAMYLLTPTGGYAFSSAISADLSEWHMYSFTWSPSGQSVYFDGQLVAQSNGESGATPIGNLYIGHNAAVDDILSRRERFQGAMDDLRIYDHPLSIAEIGALFAEIPDPRNMNDCRDGGWITFGFSNQGQCVRYLASGKDSRR